MKPPVSKTTFWRKVTCWICMVALAFACVPLLPVASAHGDDGDLSQFMSEYAQETNKIYRLAAKSDDPAFVLSAYMQRSFNSDAASSGDESDARTFSTRSVLPEKYFLTNEGTVTGVKFQNPWGACWSFANLSAIESSILKASGASSGNGEASSPKLGGLPTSPDLSEHALAWYGLTFQDKASAPGQAGEGTQVAGERSGAKQILSAPIMLPSTLLMNRQLLTSEQNIPYTYRDPDGSFHTADASWWEPVVDPQTGQKVQPYSNDWSLDTNISRSFTDTGWHVKDVVMLPSPAVIHYDETEQPVGYEYNERATLAIKERLHSVGAISMTYAADVSMPTVSSEEPVKPTANASTKKRTGTGEYMNYGENSEIWCQYNNSLKLAPDHAVSIVGWDDSYSRDNFAGTAEGWEAPPGDGAWLVKNSWGADDFFTSDYHGWDDVNHWGLRADPDDLDSSSGFFWLSYYDHSIGGLTSYEVERMSDGPENLYQYDYLGLSIMAGPLGIPTPEPAKVANIFTTKRGEFLDAVSAQTAVQNAEVNVKVYLLNQESSTPEDGELVAEKTVVPEFAGTYRIELDDPVRMAEGQEFSVVETVLGARVGDDRVSYLNLEMANELTAAVLHIESEAKHGDSETFAYSYGGWMSIEALNEEMASQPETQSIKFGNALIKAYTSDDPDPGPAPGPDPGPDPGPAPGPDPEPDPGPAPDPAPTPDPEPEPRQDKTSGNLVNMGDASSVAIAALVVVAAAALLTICIVLIRRRERIDI